MSHDSSPDFVAVLTRIDERITELRDLVVERQTVRETYSTAEVARLLDRSDFTVREWARLGRIKASKKWSGRGKFQEWVIAHEELQRYRREGLLPDRRG